jgi:hypothetical protein
MTISRCILLRREMFKTEVVEKIKIHILCLVTLFRKSCRLGENEEKCGGNREASSDNMALRFMLD